MTNFKKLDDHDVVFVNRPWTDKEKKEFSAFLKSRKAKSSRRNKIHRQVKKLASVLKSGDNKNIKKEYQKHLEEKYSEK